MDYNMYYENVILVPSIAFVVTVVLKGLNIKIQTGKLNITKTLGSGGMPSSHSAVVVSLAAAMALKHGFNSDYFAMVLAFAAIILYDAMNIRYEAGLHAVAINQSLGEKRFNESLGHLPSEAFVGSALGVIVAIVLFYI